MTSIFDEGSRTVDDAAMDEIVEFVRRTNGTGMLQPTLIRKAARTVPINKVKDTIDMLVYAGRLRKEDDKYFAIPDSKADPPSE